MGLDIELRQEADVEGWEEQAAAVVGALERARDWLDGQRDLGNVVEFRAQGRALELYTVQRQLGQEAELAAAEIVRRAERRIAFLIERDQREGAIAVSRTVAGPRHPVPMPSAKDATGLPWSTLNDIRKVGSSVTEQQFEEAIAGGRQDGNLSRAGVIRRLGGTPNGSTKKKKFRKAGDWHYRQKHLPESGTVMERQVEQVVLACESLAFDYVDVDELDSDDVVRWVTALAESARKLTRFRKELMNGSGQRNQG